MRREIVGFGDALRAGFKGGSGPQASRKTICYLSLMIDTCETTTSQG